MPTNQPVFCLFMAQTPKQTLLFWPNEKYLYSCVFVCVYVFAFVYVCLSVCLSVCLCIRV